MKSRQNRFLTLRAGVILSNDLDEVVSRMDHYYELAGVKREVTSGVRSAGEQLALIIHYCGSLSPTIPVDFTAADIGKKNEDGSYVWQMAWSRLLSTGILINPPAPAVCLTDYYGSTGVNKRGRLIQASAHQRQMAFDTSCRRPDRVIAVDESIGVLKRAEPDMAKIGIKGYKVERKQNCIHTDILPVIPREWIPSV